MLECPKCGSDIRYLKAVDSKARLAKLLKASKWPTPEEMWVKYRCRHCGNVFERKE